jgi:hypothetical protein
MSSEIRASLTSDWMLGYHSSMHWEKKQRTPLRQGSGEVGWIICGLKFCVVDNILRRGDMLPVNSHWHGRTWNMCLPFLDQSIKIPLQRKWRDFNQNEYHNATVAAFSLVVHNVKGRAISVPVLGDPYGCETSRFRHFYGKSANRWRWGFPP